MSNPRLSVQERHSCTGNSPKGVTKVVKGLDHPSCEKSVGELGLFRLIKRRPRAEGRGVINVCKYLKGGCKEDRAMFFPVVSSDRTSSSGNKQAQEIPFEYQETLFC